MKIIVHFLVVAFTSTLLLSCASYMKRKECEKINWFQHAYGVAMKGQRLDEDSMIKQCEKAEAEVNHGDLDVGFKAGMAAYCKSQNAYNEGLNGRNFNFNMCDSPRIRTLKKKYILGIAEFCIAKNGYKVGAEGYKYAGICPKKLERAFMKKYKKGRQVFLRGQIGDKEEQIDELEDKIRSVEREKRNLTLQMATLPSGKKMTRERRWDSKRRRYIEVAEVQEDNDTKNRRRNLKWDIDSKNREIDKFRKEQSKLRKEMRSLRREWRALRDGD